MTRGLIMRSLIFFAALSAANAYWLMGANIIVTERLDPIVNPGAVSGHVHSVAGGSNFGKNVTTAKLRQSQCTSMPIPQDHSNYWFPQLYFEWKNGSVSSVGGGVVIYYLFDDPPTQVAFPDDFRMISGNPALRSYNASSFAQQAVTFLCLDFNGVTTKHNELPAGNCPSGVRAQLNFPSCWDGKNVDSPDHKSHVAFLSTGPDSGTCTDPNFPVRLVRVFMEVYWDTGSWSNYFSQAANTSQPFVFSNGDSTGYGYHGDFYNGWDEGVLQNAINKCNCNEYGDPSCCAAAGIFDLNQGQQCHITQEVDEQTTGMLPKLPGSNPITGYGPNAAMSSDPNPPPFVEPVYAYTGNSPTATGTVVSQTASGSATTSSTSSSATTTSSKTSTSSSTSSGSSSMGTSSTSSPSGSPGGSNPPASGSQSSTGASSTSSPYGSPGGSNPPASGSQSSTGTSSTSSPSGSPGGSNPPASGSQSSAGSSSTSASTSTSTSSSNAGDPGKSSGGSSTSSTSTATSTSPSNTGGSGKSSGRSSSTSTATSTSPSNTGGSGKSSGGSSSTSTATSTSPSNTGGSGKSSGGNSGSSTSSSTSSSSGGYGGYGSSPSSASGGSSSSTSSSSPATTSSSTTTGSHTNGSSPASGGTSEEDNGDGEDDEPTCTPRKKQPKKQQKSNNRKSFGQHHARRRFHSSMMKA